MGVLIQGPWKPATHRNLSKVQIHRELGKSRKTIERYMDAGMPHGRNREGHAIFNIEECLEWLELQDERRRDADQESRPARGPGICA